MKLIGELEGNVLIYEIKRNRYALVDVRKKKVRAVRNWYSQTRFMELENLNGNSKYDNIAIEILKNSDIYEQFKKMDKKDEEEARDRGEKWVKEIRENDKKIEDIQNEMIKNYSTL